MGDTEAMRQALEHARRVLLKVAHADGDLHGDAWAAVWHADSALASTEAPERPKRKVSYTSSDARPAPVGERVPEGWRVEWIDRWVTPAERRHVPILVPDTPHEGEPE